MGKLCDNEFCALNWLEDTQLTYIPLRVDSNRTFVFLRIEDRHEVYAMYCPDHTVLGLLALMKLRGCD